MVMNVWKKIIIGLSVKVVPIFVIVVHAIYSSTYNMLSWYLSSHASYQTLYNNLLMN